jgi:hypothetical protein
LHETPPKRIRLRGTLHQALKPNADTTIIFIKIVLLTRSDGEIGANP